MSDEQKVTFVVAATAKGPNVRSADIPVDKLKASLEKATAHLSSVFEHVVEVGRFELQEVEIGVEVGAEGGIAFIGTATASGKAAMTLTFRPKGSAKA